MRDDTVPERGGFPNIGAFRITPATRDHIAAVASALSHTWFYLPDDELLAKYRAAIARAWDEETPWIFDSAVRMNQTILSLTVAKNLTVSFQEVSYKVAKRVRNLWSNR